MAVMENITKSCNVLVCNRGFATPYLMLQGVCFESRKTCIYISNFPVVSTEGVQLKKKKI
jgi:hypothetical protein